jgi:enamine deaminase RidA (YjgF/YER057c/UK114 family)
LPLVDGTLLSSGIVGREVSLETAHACARQCALNALAAAASVCDLDSVTRAVKLVGYVASAAGFVQQPAVINGASDVLTAAFGEAGAHAREAVGVAALPLGAPVELSVVLEVAPQERGSARRTSLGGLSRARAWVTPYCECERVLIR